MEGDEAGCLQPQGLLLVYVDDLLVLSGEEVHKALIREIQNHWQTSVPEEVDHQQWVRFCGYEMKRFEDQIMLGQPSYLRDLIKRRQVTGKRSSPMAKEMMPPEEPEQDVTVAHICEAQSIAGEILWIALRSRPDLSYAVSMLGRQVTKNPKWAVALGEQILEYLNGTPYLFYGPCKPGDRGPDGDLPKERSMNLRCTVMCHSLHKVVEVFKAWQTCMALSTAESELYSYIEAITMADLVKALWVEISCHTPEAVTYGDDMAAISIIQNPDGPWRTRHLRLRASVLKERLQEGSWRIFHLDGKRLIADVFTKAIVDKNVWSWFRCFVHFQAPEGGTREAEVVAEVKDKAKMAETVGKVAKLALCMASCAAATCLPSTRAALVATLAIGMAYVVKSSGVFAGSQGPGECVHHFPTGEFTMN